MKRYKHPDHGYHNAYTTQEEEFLRKTGWTEDIAPKAIEPAPMLEAEFDRAALLTTAKDLGIKVDGRWSTERLAEEVAKA